MPPPPSPPPPPFRPMARATVGGSSRTRGERRALRRAAEQAARQQREIARVQLRALRRRSILGPTILVSIGTVLLLLELGTLSPGVLFGFLVRWWPALLVLAGTILLAEWATDTWVSERAAGAAPRRTVGPFTVLALALLILFGIAARSLQPNAGWIQQPWADNLVRSWGFADLFAQHVVTNDELTAPMHEGELLTVRNYRGAVSVTGSSTDGMVHVAVRQRFVGWRRRDLEGRERRYKARLESTAEGVTVLAGGEGDDETSLEIEVPQNTGVLVAREKGQVSVSELHGPVTVQDHSGGVAMTAIVGTVRLSVADDDATVTGHSLDGDVSVEGRSGDLALSDLRGKLSLHGDFFGTTQLQRIAGDVHFQSSFTDLQCRGLAGELRIEGRSELQASNVQGPFVLTTTDRTLTLTELHSGGTVTDRNGDITMSLADVAAPWKVQTTNGYLTVRVPEGASFALDAATTEGEVHSDLELSSQDRKTDSALRGKVGRGGALLQLRTTHAAITLRGSDESKRDVDDDRDNSDDDAREPVQTRRL